MKKYYCLFIILFYTVNANAQFVNNVKFSPEKRDSMLFVSGENLQIFSRKMGASVACYTLSGLSLLAANKIPTSKDVFNTSAIVFGIAGLVFNIIAPSYVSKAGKLLKVLSGHPIIRTKNEYKKNRFSKNLIIEQP